MLGQSPNERPPLHRLNYWPEVVVVVEVCFSTVELCTGGGGGGGAFVVVVDETESDE
jgi:hypothetical protein